MLNVVKGTQQNRVIDITKKGLTPYVKKIDKNAKETFKQNLVLVISSGG